MCVAAWAESSKNGANSFQHVSGVGVRHVSEVLTYDFIAKTVHIRLLVLPHVQTSEPVYVHFIHRRGVSITDDTGTLVQPHGPNELIEALNLVRIGEETPEGTLANVRLEDGKEIEALVPRTSSFSLDEYFGGSPDRRADVPFTSARFGPLVARSIPYLMGLSLTIEGETFDRLIAVLRNQIARYIYSIEGPKIIARDIEPLDLRGAPDDIREPYEKVLANGVHGCGINIEGYDILTCDMPKERSHYVRLVSKLEPCRIENPLSMGGREYLVNSWHSSGTDFLIQRVSFLPA